MDQGAAPRAAVVDHSQPCGHQRGPGDLLSAVGRGCLVVRAIGVKGNTIAEQVGSLSLDTLIGCPANIDPGGRSARQAVGDVLVLEIDLIKIGVPNQLI